MAHAWHTERKKPKPPAGIEPATCCLENRALPRLDHRHPEPLVALASLAAFSLARTLVIARTHPAPARQMARSGETTHVDADLGDDHFRRSLLNARNGLQALNDLRERVQQLLDLVTAFLDGLVEVVQVSQDAPNQKPVVAPETALQGAPQLGN